jgi:hypothetical protein
MNILEKIFIIMNEYDELLENKNNNINITNNNDNNNNKKSFNKKDDIVNEMDDSFFKYIYKNINININQKNENKNFLNKMNYENNENENNENEINENNNTCDIQNNNNTCNFSSDNSYNNKNNTNNTNNNNDNNKIDNDKDNIEDEIDDINIYIKKIYKKLVLRCHPDKNGDEKLFIKCQEYYENKFLIGLLYINYKLKIEMPTLNQKIINQILFEIRVIQEKIINLKLELKKNVNK